MIDDNKIEAAKEEIYEDRFLLNGEEIVFNNDEKEEMFYKEDIKEAIGLGAKWGINELLKDMFHPASEVPRNDNGKVLAFSKEFGNRKLYDMNDELDKTTCDTYKEMWEEQVNIFHLSDWIFVEELFDLITKGGTTMIKTITMYSVVCDRCGKTFIDEFNGIGAWLDEGTAKEQAMESEWAEIGDKHYCPDCYEFDDELDEYVPKKKGGSNERA